MLDYYLRWIKRAIATLPKTIVGYTGLVFVVFAPIALLFINKPELEAIKGWTVLLGVSLVLLVRFLLVPYWMYQEDAQKPKPGSNNPPGQLPPGSQVKQRVRNVSQKLDEFIVQARNYFANHNNSLVSESTLFADMNRWQGEVLTYLEITCTPYRCRQFKRKVSPISPLDPVEKIEKGFEHLIIILEAIGDTLRDSDIQTGMGFE